MKIKTIGAHARKGRIMKQAPRFVAAVSICAWAAFSAAGMSPAQDVLKKDTAVPKLIGMADLECSFFLMESAPRLRVSAPVIAGEKTMLTEADQFYADPAPGVEAFLEDSLWTILEWGAPVRGGNPRVVLGNVAFLRGRARVVGTESGRALMKIEKACGLIQPGCLLVPFIGGDILVGTELEYRVPFQKENAPTGRIVFLESDWTQITARGHWAIVDLGEAHGLKIGTQLTVFHQEGKEPPAPIANAVVIRTGGRWATIKVLNSKDAARLGDFVQTKPAL
jgi:hypothetical protein